MCDGELVQKVQLVGDGRTHYNAGNTYAGTPSSVRFCALLHLIAHFNWNFVHIDENKAFLSA